MQQFPHAHWSDQRDLAPWIIPIAPCKASVSNSLVEIHEPLFRWFAQVDVGPARCFQNLPEISGACVPSCSTTKTVVRPVRKQRVAGCDVWASFLGHDACKSSLLTTITTFHLYWREFPIHCDARILIQSGVLVRKSPTFTPDSP